MGLQCSKQGHLQDFHSYGADTRPAPEGECTIADLTNGAKYLQETKFNTSSPKIAEEMKKLVHTLESQNINLLSSLKETREDILIGEENASFQESKLVNLPPEGKVDTEKEFVEIPSTPSSKKVSIDDCYVELPPDVTSLHRVCSKESIVSSIKRVDSKESVGSSNQQTSSSVPKDEKADSNTSTPVDNSWSYTLYDFQGKGIVTKQDLQQLMESICTVIGHSSFDISKKETRTQQQPLQLEFTRANSKTSNVKSPSKYTPSKHYKGMIFPPPNTEEAEKVSCYIEEKLTNHRDKRKEHTCREYKRRPERTSKDTCKCPMAAKKSDGLYVIPKRKELCEGDEKRLRYTQHNHEKSHCRVPKSNNSFSPDSMSGANTPQSVGDHHEHDVIMHRKVPTTVTTTSIKNKQQFQHDEALRLRHSCSCHQRIRDKLKSLETNDTVDQESNLCKQIKTAHRETRESDELSFCSSAKSSSRSSTTSSSESSNVSTTRQSSSKNRKHSNENKCSSGKSPKLLSKRYNREKAESITNVRPAVWPGECIKNDELPLTTPAIEPTNIISADNLCFCKRMLGLDYPCGHGSNVHHTHKHEHHHFHYYIPQSS